MNQEHLTSASTGEVTEGKVGDGRNSFPCGCACHINTHICVYACKYTHAKLVTSGFLWENIWAWRIGQVGAKQGTILSSFTCNLFDLPGWISCTLPTPWPLSTLPPLPPPPVKCRLVDGSMQVWFSHWIYGYHHAHCAYLYPMGCGYNCQAAAGHPVRKLWGERHSLRHVQLATVLWRQSGLEALTMGRVAMEHRDTSSGPGRHMDVPSLAPLLHLE